MKEVLLIVIAYLIGSIPTAIWLSKSYFGIDIREYGSGNSGATNTFRVLGPRWGSVVMFVDILKGVVATSLYILLTYYLTDEWERTNFMIGLGLAAVLGHIFPIWADFRGGKGVATLFGMIIAMAGCYQGLQVEGNAEEVGLRTTTAVVQGIFLVIVLHAFFPLFFTEIGCL